MSTPEKNVDPNNLGSYWREKSRQYSADGTANWWKLYLCDEEYNEAIQRQFVDGCRKIGQRLRADYEAKLEANLRRILAGKNAE